MSTTLRYSRPLAAAARLAEYAADHHRFTDKQVLLIGEPEAVSSPNGRECLLTSLRLLVRICKHVSVVVPDGHGELSNECRMVADHIRFDNVISFPQSVSDFSKFDAILCVGSRVRPNLPWTVINSNGWIARVSSACTNLAADCSQENPIAALGAACLGVSEVFKRLIVLREDRGRLLDGLEFSFYSYESGGIDPGPTLPASFPLDILLVGVGAVGNGVVHLLHKLPISGRIVIVDREVFQEENLGTCLRIGPQDLGVPKAEFAARLFATNLETQWFQQDIEAFSQRLGGELRFPKLIVNCLDSIEARHKAQDLWPNMIIDGAIGDFACQVSVHPWGSDVACLKCLFKAPVGEPSEVAAARLTGLSAERAHLALETVSADDVRNAPNDKKEWLRARVGRQICSVIREGLAQQVSSHELPENFEPSVPFVAGFSASMIVAELVRHLAGWPSALETRFQCDILRGPDRGLDFPQARNEDCICVTRRHNIELVRARRFACGG